MDFGYFPCLHHIFANFNFNSMLLFIYLAQSSNLVCFTCMGLDQPWGRGSACQLYMHVVFLSFNLQHTDNEAGRPNCLVAPIRDQAVTESTNGRTGAVDPSVFPLAKLGPAADQPPTLKQKPAGAGIRLLVGKKGCWQAGLPPRGGQVFLSNVRSSSPYHYYPYHV